MPPPPPPPKQRKVVTIVIIITSIMILVAISLTAWFIMRQQSLYGELQKIGEEAGLGKEKIISADEYMQKAEIELVEVKKYLEENDSTEVQIHTAKALEYASSATNLEPQNAEIWFRRGNIYWEIKDIAVGAEEWALKSYQKALELEPDNSLYRQKVEGFTK